MIPDDMIKKAKAAYINKRRKTCSHDSLIAALEAVAADIWEQGYEAAYRNAEAVRPYNEMWTDEEPDLIENPYRIEHA